jgi:hypothetical protein
MKNFLVVVCLLLCTSACGGDSETAAPTTTSASATTVTPTATSASATTVTPTTTTTTEAVSTVRPAQDNTHSTMKLIVPYEPSDPIDDLVPMGEKIHHSNADGHVGIDFQWEDHSGGPPKILASAAGTVLSVELDPYSNNTSLIIVLLHQAEDTRYYTAYEGLRIDSSVQPGDLINQGQIIGETWDNPDTGDDVYMIHWEFGFCPGNDSKQCAPPERLCPMSYFEKESRAILEEVWSASTNQYKQQYPHICSGAFYGRSGQNTPYQTPNSSEDSKQLEAECSFNEKLVEVSCTAGGYPSGSVLSWESTATWSTTSGPDWNFVVDPELLGSSAEVTIKACQGADCSSLTILVDTSSALGD